jgi:hypothetical protein
MSARVAVHCPRRHGSVRAPPHSDVSSCFSEGGPQTS